MFRTFPLVVSAIALAATLACERREDTIGRLALEFQQAIREPTVEAYASLCPDDRAVRSIAEWAAQHAAARALVGSMGGAEGLVAFAEKVRYSVVQVEIDDATTPPSARVTLAAELDRKEMGRPVVTMREVDRSWCVDPGWAREARRDALLAKTKADLERAAELLKDYRFEEAVDLVRRHSEELGPALASLGEDVQSSLVEQLRGTVATYEGLAARHVGGRWMVDRQRNAITDDQDVYATLRAVEPSRGLVGEEWAHLVARCRERRLELYVSGTEILDRDWRYATVSGRHRFERDEARRIVGTRGQDAETFFFRDPRRWAEQFLQRDGQTWTVELEGYQRRPVYRFDLAASKLAIGPVLEACGR